MDTSIATNVVPSNFSAVSGGRRFFARISAAAALLLLIAGGMVTSTQSGLAVPDWPLSYGSLMPHMSGGIVFEHSHRILAGIVGLLILIAAVWDQLTEKRAAIRRLSWWTFAAVVLQGVLGGVTVLFSLPPSVSSAHATLAQTIFCLLVVKADMLDSRSANVHVDGDARNFIVFGVAAILFLWAQLVLGAIARHNGLSIAPHIFWAFFAACAAGAFAARALLQSDEALRGPARVVLGLLGAQITLGVLSADLRSEPYMRSNHGMISAATAHLAVGALLLAATVLLTCRAARAARTPGQLR